MILLTEKNLVSSHHASVVVKVNQILRIQKKMSRKKSPTSKSNLSPFFNGYHVLVPLEAFKISVTYYGTRA